MTTRVIIDADEIVDWDTFHDVFAREFGFPSFYGRNMNAWIDCLSRLDDPEAGLTVVHVAPGDTLALVVENAAGLKKRCVEQYLALIECAGFVNWRMMELRGRTLGGASHEYRFEGAPLLALVFYA